MTTFFQKLSMKWDIWQERYASFIVSNQEDFKACEALLDTVRKTELNRAAGESSLNSVAFANHNVPFILVASRDTKTNEIVGCIKITDAKDLISIEESRHEYQLQIFEESHLDKIGVFTRLAVSPSYRQGPVALIIMSFSFIHYLKNGGEAILMTCEPNLFHMYKRLGLRPIGSLINSPHGGYRLPMICIPDKAYFERISSPALPLMKAIDWKYFERIIHWYLQKIASQGQISLGIQLYNEDSQDRHAHWQLTEHLSSEGMNSFTKNAIKIECKEGDLLLAENDGGKNMGIVMEGYVLVKIDGKLIAVLNKGEVFGEMAFILNQHRSADVYAGSDNTIVLLFSKSSISRLENKEDLIQIWKNLATIMARRLELNNQALFK